MKRYFKRKTPTDFEEGTVYFEFDGEIPVRQVEVYGERFFSSREEYHDELGPGLVNQTLSSLHLTAEDEISIEEFERVWSESGNYNEEGGDTR